MSHFNKIINPDTLVYIDRAVWAGAADERRLYGRYVRPTASGHLVEVVQDGVTKNVQMSDRAIRVA